MSVRACRASAVKPSSHAMRKLAENLRLEYAQFLELEIFTRFGGMVDERTQRDHRAWATNPRGSHAAAIRAAFGRTSSGVAGGYRRTAARPACRSTKCTELQAKLGDWLKEHAAEPMRQIDTTGELEPDTRAALVDGNRRVGAQRLIIAGAAPAKP